MYVKLPDACLIPVAGGRLKPTNHRVITYRVSLTGSEPLLVAPPAD